MTDISNDYRWWQTGVIYQVYPRSFQDTDENGVGDIKGIINRLDYLSWLGVQAIWVSPVYPSPMADFGYDISDYQGIDLLFGSEADFDQLIEEVHQRSMKLILDLVPNHTSDLHPWFEASRVSKNNDKRDWYIWQDGTPGIPPNNWLAAFGGSGWEWDEKTGQYYFHSFLKEQPDLNWRNPQVREAVYDVMRFWLDKGVDGFRIDVLWHLIKDKQLRDNPPNPAYEPHMATYDQLLPVFSTDQPEVQDIVQEMRRVMDEYNDRMMIGEVYLPVDKLITYYGPQNNGAHLPFNFQLIFMPWDARRIALAIDEYESFLPQNAWPNWVLGNHDQPRLASRLGREQAKVAAILLLTLRGTPTLYYGDEIGMVDVPVAKDQIKDPVGLNMPDKSLSRDPARTPMQWDDTEYAGFSRRKTWLPVAKNYKLNNVARQTEDRYSLLWLYRRLIVLRQKEPSLTIGSYRSLHHDNQALAFIRRHHENDCFLIILNLSHRPCCFESKQLHLQGIIEVATDPDLEGIEVENSINLYGDEGVVIRLKNTTQHDRS